MIARNRVERPVVHIKFWDHSTGPADSATPLLCEVFGVLRDKNDLSYTVVAWVCENDLTDSNSDAYCILRSTVVYYRQLNKEEVDCEGNNQSNEGRHSTKPRAGKANRKAGGKR